MWLDIKGLPGQSPGDAFLFVCLFVWDISTCSYLERQDLYFKKKHI